MFVSILSMILNVLSEKKEKKKRNKPTQTSDFYERTMKKKLHTQGCLSGQLIMKDIHFCLLLLPMKVSFPCKNGCKFISNAKAHLSNIPAHKHFHELDG